MMKTIGKVLVFTLAVSLVAVVSSGVLPFYNPSTLAAEELEKVHMEIKGMTCSGCSAKVQSNLARLSEVKGSDVNWQKGTADVKVLKGSDHKALMKTVQDSGFTVSSLSCECKG